MDAITNLAKIGKKKRVKHILGKIGKKMSKNRYFLGKPPFLSSFLDCFKQSSCFVERHFE
jgi:hypothetical protein